MTLTQLGYILAVDRCRNFAQAARESFVTQPTLSMQIQKLEDYLQIIIFDRSKNPVIPTPMGRKVLDYAKKILKASQELEELSRSLRGEVSGEFILSVIPTLAPYLLPLFVQKFMEEFPNVELKISESQTDQIVRDLKEGKVDAGLVAVPLEVKELEEERLFLEPFRIFLSHDHNLLKKKLVAEEELNMHEAWLLQEGHCLRTQVLGLCQNNRTKSQKQLFFEAGSLETLVQMVKSGKGFTVLPHLACANLSDSDRMHLRGFKDKTPVREIAFVTGPHSMKKSIQKALVEVILKNLPPELRKDLPRTEIQAIYE
jgi:LysR family hydrogen peroxide-inducible transcriptional activator